MNHKITFTKLSLFYSDECIGEVNFNTVCFFVKPQFLLDLQR